MRLIMPGGYLPGLSRYLDGTGTTGTAGRDGTVKPSSNWPRRPVTSRRQILQPLSLTVPSRHQTLPRCTFLPSRPVKKITPVVHYRPAPSTISLPLEITVPSRRDTVIYRPVPSSKPAPLSLPSRPADKTCPLPSKIHPCPLSLPVHSHQEFTNLRNFVFHIGNSLCLYFSQQPGMYIKLK